jgi:hypothetical protein
MTAATADDRVIEFNPVKGSELKGSITVSEKLQILKDKEQPKAGWRCFRVLTPKDGDKRVTWDSADLDQINEAKLLFDQLIQEGLVPYRVGVNGNATSEVMDEFDPDAEEVIFIAVAAAVTGG